MPTFKPLYSSISSDFAGSGFTTLGNGSTQTSDAVDNSSNLYQDYLIEIGVTGTAAVTAWIEIRVASSLDGSVYNTWESSIPIGIINFSATPQRGAFSIVGHGGFMQCPRYFKIMVKNNTGAAFTNGTIKYVGVQIQSN